MKTERTTISVLDGRYLVNAIVAIADSPKALMVLGHGAGAGMEHRFMSQLAENLAGHGVSSLRYNFPYIEQGRRTPTSPSISQATIRAAVEKVHQSIPHKLLLVGGKSYGGRMSSQAQAEDALPGVSGLVFFGFPLHAPGKPGSSRGDHLRGINIPMLFLQGSRDKLADLNLLTPLINSLENQSTLEVLEGADHSFNMPKSAVKTSAEAQQELAEITSGWMDDNFG